MPTSPDTQAYWAEAIARGDVLPTSPSAIPAEVNDQAPLTVDGLQSRETVTPGEVIGLVWRSAEQGNAIDGEAVARTLFRSSPEEHDLWDMREAAIDGIIGVVHRTPFGSDPERLKELQTGYAHVLGKVGFVLSTLK